jgi:DNA-binding MarR family transcriptional regulator
MAASENPRWLDDDQSAAWRRFIAVVELLPGILDSQLRRDADLTHFEYFTLAMLSEASDRTLRMSRLALETNSTLPRLSHVASRLEKRGLVERVVSADDRRATDITLTDTGLAKVIATAPGHVDTVRSNVIDLLDDDDVEDLARIMTKILVRLDPERSTGHLD